MDNGGRTARLGSVVRRVAVPVVAGIVLMAGVSACGGEGAAEPGAIGPAEAGNRVVDMVVDPAPEIVVTAGSGVALPWTAVRIGADGGAGGGDAGKPVLELPAERGGIEQAPLVALGETITIEFPDAMPSSLALIDDIVDERGTVRWGGGPDIVELSIGAHSASFPLAVDLKINVSSNSDDYLPGAVRRGFVITATDGSRIYRYGFVLRTDAS